MKGEQSILELVKSTKRRRDRNHMTMKITLGARTQTNNDPTLGTPLDPYEQAESSHHLAPDANYFTSHNKSRRKESRHVGYSGRMRGIGTRRESPQLVWTHARGHPKHVSSSISASSPSSPDPSPRSCPL